MTLLSFFFTDTATTAIYTLSLHDALPISVLERQPLAQQRDRVVLGGVLHVVLRAVHLRVADVVAVQAVRLDVEEHGDRKSTRLNSSHMSISYAVFCLKKKKKTNKEIPQIS